MIHEVGDRFEERNLFLHAALGLLSWGHRLEAFLESAGAQPAAAVAPGKRGEADPLVDFLLGLISVSHTVRGHLSGASQSGLASADPAASPQLAPLHRHLRRLLA